MAEKRIEPARFERNGRVVEIAEDDKGVRLTIDRHPVEVEIVDGKYSSHLANMFVMYDDIYQLVDELFANEGRTWVFKHSHHPHPEAIVETPHVHDEQGPDADGGELR